MWTNMKKSEDEPRVAGAIQLGNGGLLDVNWSITIKNGNYNWDFSLVIGTGAGGNIIVNWGNFDWKILVETGVAGTFEISAWKFSADPSAYVVAWKEAKEISEGNLVYEVADKPAQNNYSGWWGGGSSKASSSKDDTKATTEDTAKADEQKADEAKADEDKSNEEDNNQQPENKAPMTDAEAVAKFGQEQIDAYKWALENGITTMETVEDARLDQPLTRAELAKMMVVYIAKVLEKQPLLTWTVTYPDVTEKLGDLAGYIQLAYQYQIMGIDANGDPIAEFNPNGIVSRWEYATVFSRVLFGSLFNKEWADFYTDHLKALETAGILTNTEPTIKEMRGWVMLMMYRSAQNADKIAEVISTLWASEQEAADAQSKAEEEKVAEAPEVDANTWDVAEAPEADATTWDVAEAPEAEATTWDVAEVPAEASTWDTASN